MSLSTSASLSPVAALRVAVDELLAVPVDELRVPELRVEAVLCDARISRVLLDGFGQVKGLEALSDSVTATQRAALAARDLGCAARGCTRPPAMCDAHHLQACVDGGPTTLANLVLLCRRHHRMWHDGQLRLTDLRPLAPAEPRRHRPRRHRTTAATVSAPAGAAGVTV